MFSNPFKKKEVNYEELDGAAAEAARAALKGEVRGWILCEHGAVLASCVARVLYHFEQVYGNSSISFGAAMMLKIDGGCTMITNKVDFFVGARAERTRRHCESQSPPLDGTPCYYYDTTCFSLKIELGGDISL